MMGGGPVHSGGADQGGPWPHGPPQPWSRAARFARPRVSARAMLATIDSTAEIPMATRARIAPRASGT